MSAYFSLPFVHIVSQSLLLFLNPFFTVLIKCLGRPYSRLPAHQQRPRQGWEVHAKGPGGQLEERDERGADQEDGGVGGETAGQNRPHISVWLAEQGPGGENGRVGGKAAGQHRPHLPVWLAAVVGKFRKVMRCGANGQWTMDHISGFIYLLL